MLLFVYIGMAQSRPIPTTSFYGKRWNRIRVGTNGVEREEQNVEIMVPELFSSDVEDNEVENEIEIFQIASSERTELDSDAEDLPKNADEPDFVTDDMDGTNESKTDKNKDEQSAKPKGGSSKSKKKLIADPPRRWMKHPAEVNNEFLGEPFPDPPVEK